MKVGTRVMVRDDLAEEWGHEPVGTIIGGDPRGHNPDVVSVKMDDGLSIFETKGVHVNNLESLEPQSQGGEGE